MRKLSTIEAYVRPYVASCPSFIVTNQILLAARDFFQASRTWTEKFNQTLGADESAMYLAFGDDVEIIDIGLSINDAPLTNAVDPQILPEPSAGRPVAFAVINNEEVKFSHAPTADTEITVFATIKPGLSATSIPDRLLNQWMEGVRDLTIYQLLMMPKRAWTDYALASEFKKNYRGILTRAKTQQRAGTSVGDLTASPRPFA